MVFRRSEKAEEELNGVKYLMTNLLTLTPYDPDQPLFLLCDPSYKLVLVIASHRKMGKGDTDLSKLEVLVSPPTQQLYSVYKLELLALTFASKNANIVS